MSFRVSKLRIKLLRGSLILYRKSMWLEYLNNSLSIWSDVLRKLIYSNGYFHSSKSIPNSNWVEAGSNYWKICNYLSTGGVGFKILWPLFGMYEWTIIFLLWFGECEWGDQFRCDGSTESIVPFSVNSLHRYAML